MKFSYIMRISFKNLKRYKLRFFLTAGGVAISIGFISFLVSLGYGLQKVSTEQIANLEALQMLNISSGKSKIVKIDNGTVEKISNIPEVEKVFPEASLASELSFGSSKIDGIVYGKKLEILGIDKPKLSNGRYFSTNKADEAMINIPAAKKLGVSNMENILGKTITLKMIIRPELMENAGDTPKIETKTLRIAGVLEEGNSPYAYVPLDFLEGAGVKNYNGAKIKARNKDAVDKVKIQVEHMGFKADSIKDTVAQVDQFFSVFRAILLGFGAIAVIVACIGMFNTLTISLIEKTREIGIMKSLGTTKKDIQRMFLMEALLIGIVGGVVGILGSYFIGATINASVATLARSTGNTPVDLFVFPTGIILLGLLISIVISVLTGYYPAKRATKISTLDALRYE